MSRTPIHPPHPSPTRGFHPRRRVAGVSLLEVLIAVLVMGIGLLGIAAVQTSALKYSQGSMGRSQAVISSYAAFDMVRAALPRDAAEQPARRADAIQRYGLKRTCKPPAADGSQAGADKQAWISAMQASMGDSACGAIDCDGASGVCAVTVEWDESRLPDGKPDQSIVTRSQI